MILAYSKDGCPACERVKDASSGVAKYMVWSKLSGGGLAELARMIAADLYASTDTDDIELPIVVMAGESTVGLFCEFWQEVPEQQKVECVGDVCKLVPHGQTWSFSDDETEQDKTALDEMVEKFGDGTIEQIKSAVDELEERYGTSIEEMIANNARACGIAEANLLEE